MLKKLLCLVFAFILALSAAACTRRTEDDITGDSSQTDNVDENDLA